MRAKSYAKVNIFLKITGFKDGYHQILSRFMRVKSLYDEIEFVKAECESFTVEGVDIPTKENIITKAFYALNRATGNLDILEFFYNYKVVIKKNIPTQAGLGGGSSNAGVFLNMVNEVCSLGLSKDELAKIGSEVGADVPFFVYGFDSANVSGFGEVVEKFDEEALNLEIFTPPVNCNTAKVYQIYRQKNRKKIIDIDSFKDWQKKESLRLLREINSPALLNDLYQPALELCPKLKAYQKEGYFFSGSGSSFFKLKL